MSIIVFELQNFLIETLPSEITGIDQSIRKREKMIDLWKKYCFTKAKPSRVTF